MGPGDLEQILAGLPEEGDPKLISSIHTGEDAGVYMLSDDLALVQTVDFFPPIVDDPYAFGEIAAANALSDLYAMGARPLTAMNIVAFPCKLDLEILKDILSGGHEKIRQAGAVIVGGHTIEDDEPKYGLAVTGLVRPSQLTTISGAEPGDRLLLTKPLGTGILTTALKGGFIDEEGISEAVLSMRTLNREPADIFARLGINACTDVSGFGLVGHLHEMALASGVAAEIWVNRVPLFERTVEMAGMGMVTGAPRDFVKVVEPEEETTDEVLMDCLFDPQTSGGLLASVRPDRADAVLEELTRGPCPKAVPVGVLTEGPPGRITVRRNEVGQLWTSR